MKEQILDSVLFRSTFFKVRDLYINMFVVKLFIYISVISILLTSTQGYGMHIISSLRHFSLFFFNFYFDVDHLY